MFVFLYSWVCGAEILVSAVVENVKDWYHADIFMAFVIVFSSPYTPPPPLPPLWDDCGWYDVKTYLYSVSLFLWGDCGWYDVKTSLSLSLFLNTFFFFFFFWPDFVFFQSFGFPSKRRKLSTQSLCTKLQRLAATHPGLTERLPVCRRIRSAAFPRQRHTGRLLPGTRSFAAPARGSISLHSGLSQTRLGSSSAGFLMDKEREILFIFKL